MKSVSAVVLIGLIGLPSSLLAADQTEIEALKRELRELRQRTEQLEQRIQQLDSNPLP